MTSSSPGERSPGGVAAWLDAGLSDSVGRGERPGRGELNTDLVALGYATRARLQPRSASFGPATTTAVKKLQAALGVARNGPLARGQVVFEPYRRADDERVSQLGARTQAGETAMQATSTVRPVQVALAASEQTEVAVGDKVTSPCPITTPARVSCCSVATVATCPSSSASGGSRSSPPRRDGRLLVRCSGSGSAAPSPWTSRPPDPTATGTWDQAPVQVGITTATVQGALVVPVAALLARSGGGYAVEVVVRRPRKPSRAGLARTVRRRRRASAGHRLGLAAAENRGRRTMTHTPPPTPDNNAVDVGNGVASRAPGCPLLDVDDVTKSYPGEPPVQALRA